MAVSGRGSTGPESVTCLMTDEQPEDSYSTHTIGGQLRQAREARGISLDQIASQTRIPTRHLQHIENEEWDALPAVTYCVGFVRAYANAVGLDGAELSRQVRDQLGGLRTRAPAAEYYEPADPARVPPKSLAIVAGVIALVLIVGYAIWRSSLGSGETAPGNSVTVALPEAAAPAQPQSAAPANPQAVAGQPVTLAATEEVWLRITDASGAALFDGIMAAGQSFAVPATAQGPVIRTGRPQVLLASVGGRDLGPLEPAERTISNVSLRAEDVVARLQGAANAAQPAAAGAPPPAR